MTTLDTAEIRARHIGSNQGSGSIVWYICSQDGGSYPCDAIKACDALDEVVSHGELVAAYQAGYNDRRDGYCNADLNEARITEQAAEIKRLHRVVNEMLTETLPEMLMLRTRPPIVTSPTKRRTWWQR